MVRRADALQPTDSHVPSGRYVFYNSGTRTFLNALNYETNPGTPVVMCVGSGASSLTNNIWNLMLTDSEGYTLQSVGTFNFAAPSGGSVVISNDPTQQWSLVPGQAPFSFVIQPLGDNYKAMEPQGDSSANAVPVVLNAPNGSAFQDWFICAVKV